MELSLFLHYKLARVGVLDEVANFKSIFVSGQRVPNFAHIDNYS